MCEDVAHHPLAATQEENESFKHECGINKKGLVARVAGVTCFLMLGLEAKLCTCDSKPIQMPCDREKNPVEPHII